MKARKAWAEAWRVWKGRFGEALCFGLLETALRAAVFAPLLFLAGGRLKWLALLTPVLFVLVVLPARQRAADVLQKAVRGGPLFSRQLILGREKGWYGRELVNGLKNGFFLLLWALPVIALSVWFWQLWFGKAVSGSTDFYTLLFNIGNLGGGDMFVGLLYIALIWLGTALPVLVGSAFHSARRHEQALGGRRFLPRKGARAATMRAWLLGLVTLIPFLAVVAVILAGYGSALITFAKTMRMNFPPVKQNLWLLGGAFLVLVMPVLSLKALITAACAHDLWAGHE